MASVGGSEDHISLNIMPMLDIFSILILFLLMNFSTEPISHDLDKGVELPESLSTRSLDEVPTIIIGSKAIFVNGNKLIDLVNGKVRKQDLSQGAIVPLFQELEKVAEANKKFAETHEDKPSPRTITLEVDKRRNFKLIKQVMRAAQQAGFIAFKLMVAKQEIT